MNHLPATLLQPLAPVWPLARWGINIVGPLPTALGGFCFAVVVMEYFSNWEIKSTSIFKFF